MGPMQAREHSPRSVEQLAVVVESIDGHNDANSPAKIEHQPPEIVPVDGIATSPLIHDDPSTATHSQKVREGVVVVR